MPEKLTLSAYLAQRGKKAKALKKGEAEAFGIPYPLQAGWPWRYGTIEITPAMLVDAERRVQLAKRGARSRAQEKSVGPVVTLHLPMFHGFVVRRARRYSTRSFSDL